MSLMKSILKLFRVKHWVKNGFIFVPTLVSGNIFNTHLFADVFLVFLIFCLASSVVYIFNDIQDIEEDKRHPIKRFRPLPLGDISIAAARGYQLLLMVSIAALVYVTGSGIVTYIASYIMLNYLYSKWIRNIALLDVMVIAIGFVIRVQAGVWAADIESSHWLIAMTFSICMLLALGKRKAEIVHTDGISSRVSLTAYNIDLINMLQILFVCCTSIFYVMYTLFTTNFPGETGLLFYSSIFVIAGLCRYLQISTSEYMIEEPTNIVFRDKFILISISLWVLFFMVCIFI